MKKHKLKNHMQFADLCCYLGWCAATSQHCLMQMPVSVTLSNSDGSSIQLVCLEIIHTSILLVKRLTRM